MCPPHPEEISSNPTYKGEASGGCGGAASPPPNWDDAKKSGKIMKPGEKNRGKSGKKYAKMREIRNIAIRKINKIKWRQFF